MTPNQLLESLNALPADAPLVFHTEAGPIGDGYHVTELKHARITSIDCGARVAQWDEASLQLLDGQGEEHMAVGKFSAIVRQSIRRVKALAECPMHVEFAHGNSGLRIYQLSGPRLEEGVVAVHLAEGRARCKPALEQAAAGSEGGCCGAGARTQCCR
ncbi:DUF6428 family protein [Roseibium salinum]|uniref:DUF6428 family protein n=1 Tax=Roseibium salinum TaxID=1604349 RepID=A0ABT3QXS6_9HYPH|nr:DUF6428 family protein [Roseibium sp. DSM 29163]MCX2721724.1 DUF6428 family protein [Roseibium sp. DSM 29163]